jgi:hypothetical protein
LANTPPGGGFQPRNTPAERRAFFDVDRQLTEMRKRLDDAEAKLADHETRIDVLEP